MRPPGARAGAADGGRVPRHRPRGRPPRRARRGTRPRFVPEGLGIYAVASQVPAFLREHPGLELLLVAESPVADLARREADVALRLVRPRQRELLVRKVATIPFQPYAAKSYLRRRARPDSKASSR